MLYTLSFFVNDSAHHGKQIAVKLSQEGERAWTGLASTDVARFTRIAYADILYSYVIVLLSRGPKCNAAN